MCHKCRYESCLSIRLCNRVNWKSCRNWSNTKNIIWLVFQGRIYVIAVTYPSGTFNTRIWDNLSSYFHHRIISLSSHHKMVTVHAYMNTCFRNIAYSLSYLNYLKKNSMERWCNIKIWHYEYVNCLLLWNLCLKIIIICYIFRIEDDAKRLFLIIVLHPTREYFAQIGTSPQQDKEWKMHHQLRYKIDKKKIDTLQNYESAFGLCQDPVVFSREGTLSRYTCCEMRPQVFTL